MMITEIMVIILGYILGSIPFAYIIGRATRGIDIRKLGNAGTLNVMRRVGPVAGFFNLALDMGKGALAVGIAQWLDLSPVYVYITGFAAVVGHSWPVFLRFRGGGGLATTMGVLLGVAPAPFGLSAIIIIIAVLITSNVRFGAGIGLTFLPLFIWLLGGSLDLIFFSIGLSIFMVLRNTLKFKREFTAEEGTKGMIVDREYTPWQTRRKKKSRQPAE